MIATLRLFLIGSIGLALAACVKTPPSASIDPVERQAIEARLMRDISTLASDEFGGRRPGSDGEHLTVNYLIEEMQAAGLVSGTNDPGSAWRAPVRLVSSEPTDGTVSIAANGEVTRLNSSNSYAVTSGRRLLVSGAEIVFVGKGTNAIPASEIAGKVVAIDSYRTTASISDFIRNHAAAIVHIVDGEATIIAQEAVHGVESSIIPLDREESYLTAYITYEVMSDLLGQQEWENLFERSYDRDFVSEKIDAKITIEATSRRREFTSYNVVGKIPGRIPGSGAVLLMAHWDHLGDRTNGCRPAGEDFLCNGALDNASGVASMLELARRVSASGPQDRDIYFLATTSEELGLLGAREFVEEPSIPLDEFVAVFNFDMTALAPSGSNMGFVGEGRTPLDPLVRSVLRNQGRSLGSRTYANSFSQRLDSWVFQERGIPAVTLSSTFASEITLRPFLSADYHRASDEVERLELGGAVDDLLFHDELIRRVANIATYSPPE